MRFLNTSKIGTVENPPDANAPEIIRLNDLSVRYTIGSYRDDLKSRVLDGVLQRNKKKHIWALKNVSLNCNFGEIIGVIGSNGAGKTTLCRVLSGLIKPDDGTLKIHGIVSALFSLGTGFRQDLTGRENIFLNGMMLGFSRHYVEAISKEIIEFSEIGAYIDQPLKFYSNGMKARLGFSIASMMEPDILVLDEALSTGDLKFSEKAGAKLQEIIGKSKLVIIVTHKMNFVKTFCTRAIWLDQGGIRADGVPERIIKEYSELHQPVPKRPAVKREINLTETISSVGSTEMVRLKKVGVKFLLKTPGAGLKNRKSRSANKDRKSRSAKWALRDINFKVMEGEILGVIGPNAAGKSTLCRALCGILKPDTGSVDVKGRITALVSFGTGFKAELSGKDNIYLNGMMLGLAKKEVDRLFHDIVEFSGLNEKVINQPVKKYSNGMRARLGFSIASMLKPDVFIIDEALNAGDVAFYEKAGAKIQELIKGAKATIIVTHNIHFIEKVCTRVIFLDKGNVLFDGSPAEAVSMYRLSV